MSFKRLAALTSPSPTTSVETMVKAVPMHRLIDSAIDAKEFKRLAPVLG